MCQGTVILPCIFRVNYDDWRLQYGSYLALTATPASAADATPLRAYFVIVLAIAATSSAAIFILYALEEAMPPLLIAGGRLVVAALVLTPIALRRYRNPIMGLSRRESVLIVVAGVCLAAHFTAWVSSLQLTTVLVSVVIVSTGPIWVAIMEVYFLRIRLSRLVISGLLVALLGGVIIGVPLESAASADLTNLDSTARGGGLALIGALTVSVYMLIGRRLRRKLPVVPYVWLVYSVASVCTLAVMLLTSTPLLGYRPQGYLIVLAMGLVPQLLGHSSLNYLLEYFPAALVSMFSQLEPIGSALLALVLFGQMPPEQQIFGSAIIICGVLMASRGEIRQTAPKSNVAD